MRLQTFASLARPVPSVQPAASDRSKGGPPSITSARELGFTLDEVRALLSLSEADGKTACTDVREIAGSRLAEVKARQRSLTYVQWSGR